MSHHLISLSIIFPLFGVFWVIFFSKKHSRWAAFLSSLAASACAFLLMVSMQPQTSSFQESESFSWISSYSIQYDVAIDGLNILMVLLISILFPILIASEWQQKTGVRAMHSLFLILQSSLFGAVCSQDLFLQFFFWGLSTLPFYFLVGIWGGSEKEKVAFRYIIATSLGNAFVLAALVLIYCSVDPHSFSLRELMGGKLSGKTFIFLKNEFSVSTVSLTLFSLGLCFRVPIWPIHNWFSEMAQEAPFSVFVALASTSVPVALTLFIRSFYFLFPELLEFFGKIMILFGMMNLLFGGFCSFSQRDLRKLIAFICLSEIGLILLGIGSLNTIGVVGATYHTFILALSLAGFGLFSAVIAEQVGNTLFLGSTQEKLLGGIVIKAPTLSIIAGLVIISLLGFPGFGGFVGHALIMIGSYAVQPFTLIISAIALLLLSYCLFTMYRFVFLGPPSLETEKIEDLTFRQRAYMIPIVICLIFFGIYPKPFIDLIRPTILNLLSEIK